MPDPTLTSGRIMQFGAGSGTSAWTKVTGFGFLDASGPYPLDKVLTSRN
jgi:hypothetical protein